MASPHEREMGDQDPPKGGWHICEQSLVYYKINTKKGNSSDILKSVTSWMIPTQQNKVIN